MEIIELNRLTTCDGEPAQILTAQRTSLQKYNQGKVDFERLKATLRPYHLPLLQRLLPNGKVCGHEYVALNPTRSDTALGSFKINIHTGRWSDFATGDKGNDIISLWAYVRNLSQIESAKELQAIVGGV